MLNKLILRNFQKQQDLTLEFTAGMNALLGANEAGKSTIFRAIMYALYGVRALPGTIDEMVTWGEEPKTLRVDLYFTHGTADFHIYRTKASAELAGPGLTASGHKGVTDFITKLLGADLDVASKVLVANQDDVRRALEAGSYKLIEDLSGIDLVDTLIDQMQAHTRTGTTKEMELRLVDVQAKLDTPPNVDLTPQKEAVSVAHNLVLQADSLREQAQHALDLAGPRAENARLAIGRHGEQRRRRDTLEARIAQSMAQIEAYTPVEVPDIELLQTQATAYIQQRAAEKLYNDFRKIEQHKVEGTREDYSEVLSLKTEQLQTTVNRIREYDAEIKHNQGHLTGSGKCPTCGHATTDLAELERVQTKARSRIAELKILREALVKLAEAVQGQLQSINNTQAQVLAMYPRMAKFQDSVKLDYTVWPEQWGWVGPDVFPQDATDYAAELKRAEGLRDQRIRDDARMVAVREMLDTDRGYLEAATNNEAIDVLACNAVIVDYESRKTLLASAVSTLNGLQRDAMQADSNLKLAEQAAAHAQAQFDTLVAQAATLERDIQNTLLNNGIIKKLRDSRKSIADKLWQSVLSMVSIEFSRIRGVQSVVTKGSDGFMIDGRAVGLYSGSTIDSMAIAVRGALQKIFLGNVDFVMLDEPAAGMDDSRESNLLGQIASCGIPQQFVITHSDLANSFAANLVQVG